MLHTRILDIKIEKIKISKAEDFVKSSNYGASIIFFLKSLISIVSFILNSRKLLLLKSLLAPNNSSFIFIF